jgi:hypothetical protein
MPEVVGPGELKASMLGAGIRRARAIARKYRLPGEPSMVDALIADRRHAAEGE